MSDLLEFLKDRQAIEGLFASIEKELAGYLKSISGVDNLARYKHGKLTVAALTFLVPTGATQLSKLGKLKEVLRILKSYTRSQLDEFLPKFRRFMDEGLVSNVGKIWDDIIGTQPLYDSKSLIYKSFELKMGDSKIWVHGNATEHLRELELNILKDISKTPEAKRLSIELILTDFQGAIKEATKNGVIYDQLIPIGRWEFKFSKARESNKLPALIHAQPK